MTLLAPAAALAAALPALMGTAGVAVASVSPVHSVQVEHRGNTYKVDYRAKVTTSSRTIGIAPSTRTSSQRCIMTARVSVERAIADGGHELAAALPGEEKFTRSLPGDCSNRGDQIARLVEDKAPAIGDHLAQTAAADRSQALAAIDAAHHFAAN